MPRVTPNSVYVMACEIGTRHYFLAVTAIQKVSMFEMQIPSQTMARVCSCADDVAQEVGVGVSKRWSRGLLKIEFKGTKSNAALAQSIMEMLRDHSDALTT